MNKELEVNWVTRHKEVGEILIKTLDLNSYYVYTDNKTYHTFGVDSEVAKSCFPTLPMLMTRYIKQALTPPSAAEVCKALSEWYNNKTPVKGYNITLDSNKSFVVNNGYDWIARYYGGNVILGYDCLPPHIIEIIARFYKEESNE